MTFRIHLLTLTLLVMTAANLARPQQPNASSPREQLQQDVAQLQANPSDDALRTKIIQLALTLDPKPAIPTEAIEHEGGAEYAFKHAQSPADFTSAAAEYEKSLLIAPWISGDYYNLGVCYYKAGAPQKAIAAYQFYLLAAPGAKDADDVVKQIGALKYQIGQAQEREERALEQQRQAQQQADAAAEVQRAIAQRLEGRYVAHAPNYGDGRAEDLFLDVKDGQVTFGNIYTAAPKHTFTVGVYTKTFTAPLNGTHFHYQDAINVYDGTFADDGTSATLTLRNVYTWTFQRQ